MNNNVVVLTGYACNGKSTLIEKIVKKVEEKTKRKVIVVPESVAYGFISSKIIGIQNSKFDIRQALFLSCSLGQLSIIEQFYQDDRFIILCDRSITDVLAFCLLFKNSGILEKEIRKIKKKIKEKLGNNDFEKFKYLYFFPPENKEIVENCLKREDRNITIGQSIEEYYKKEKQFRDIYSRLVKDITYFVHPADSKLTEVCLIDEICKNFKFYEIY